MQISMTGSEFFKPCTAWKGLTSTGTSDFNHLSSLAPQKVACL